MQSSRNHHALRLRYVATSLLHNIRLWIDGPASSVFSLSIENVWLDKWSDVPGLTKLATSFFCKLANLGFRAQLALMMLMSNGFPFLSKGSSSSAG